MQQKSRERGGAELTQIPFIGRLQPCPFCGCLDLWLNSDLEPKFVACRKCSAFGPTSRTVTEAGQCGTNDG
jgi:restriction alleviation protein Lar